MQHSIIIQVGENLVYQYSNQPKPTPESSSSPVEYNRALPEWENTSTNCLIKKADQPAFQEYIDMLPDQLTKGINIPFNVVETYSEGAKKLARLNKDKEQNTSIMPLKAPMPYTHTDPPKLEPTTTFKMHQHEPQNMNNELRVSFEITIDDYSGEPKIMFNNNNKLDIMTQKLLKSFIIKGIAKGVDVVSVSESEYEIKIK